MALATGAGAASLDAYRGALTTAQLRIAAANGFDVTEMKAGLPAELIMTPDQARRLGSLGLRLTKATSFDRAARMRASAVSGYAVYRTYSEPGGIADEIRAVGAAHPDIATVVELGTTVQGKPILALRVRKGSGKRPAVLYVATQHAREWLATETGRRLMHYFVDGYGTNPTVTDLINTRELWFVPVANPDGYDYTFTPGQPSLAQEPARQQR